MAETDFEGRLFKRPAGSVEKDRSRLIILISGVAVFLVIGLIIVQQMYYKGSVKIEFARAGSAEFDSYKDFVILSNIERFTGQRLGINYARLKCRVQNTGDKSIVALQVRMAALDFESNTHKRKDGSLVEKFITIIPSQLTGRKSIEPDDAMNIELNLEPVPDPDSGELMDIIVEVVGLKVK
ncbi:MAG: hypothetical protein AB1631_10295 [Acidobacteriota bacterium]